jgi:hypothetical protein
MMRPAVSKLALLGAATALSCIASGAAAQAYVADTDVVAPATGYYVAPAAPFFSPTPVVVPAPAPAMLLPQATYVAPAPVATTLIDEPATVAPRERIVRERVVREEVVVPRERVVRTRVLPPRERIVRQRTAVAPRERIIRERIVREEVTPSAVQTVVAPREVVVAPPEPGIVTTGFSTEPRRCILDLNGFERCY